MRRNATATTHPAPRTMAPAPGAVAMARLALCCLLLAAASGQAAGPGKVTIYRCTASDGTVSLGNTPCAEGQRGEQRMMQRPQDPPVGATRGVEPAPVPAATPASPPAAVRVVRVQAPEPMYGCTTPDGERYLSEDGRGTPRWVPLWVGGFAPPAGPRPPRPHPGPGPGRPPHPGHGVVATGTWVQDPCERLPQEDVCAHLSDRRYEILRVYHAAMPSEREALDAEQAGIDARLARDCPGS